MAEFAIIETGGKQYKVKAGETIKVEKLADPTQDKPLEFKDILSGKKVTATIAGEGKGPKVKIAKFKAKKRYDRVTGHRQLFSLIKIESIG